MKTLRFYLLIKREVYIEKIYLKRRVGGFFLTASNSFKLFDAKHWFYKLLARYKMFSPVVEEDNLFSVKGNWKKKKKTIRILSS